MTTSLLPMTTSRLTDAIRAAHLSAAITKTGPSASLPKPTISAVQTRHWIAAVLVLRNTGRSKTSVSDQKQVWTTSLDNITGQDCLHLEVWWNQNAYYDNGYDITNVRLYQKTTLPAGRYYFGASYPSAEANEDLYIFASDRLLNTSDIPTQSIAFEQVKKAPADGTFRGLFFTLEEETEVYLGFQTDFSKVQTNNLRVSGVKLLYYGQMNAAKVVALLQDIETELATLTINDNTGFYRQEAVDALQPYIDAARTIDNNSTYDEIIQAYNNLATAYTDLIKNGKNPAGEPDDIGATDLTASMLVESTHFSRIDGQSTTTCGSIRAA